MKWDKALQAKYFDLLVSKDFIEDYEAIKDKDAREKTSGLADIGLLITSILLLGISFFVYIKLIV